MSTKVTIQAVSLFQKMSSWSSQLVLRRALSSGPVARALTPRRALMYVPGCDERKVAKVPGLGADCVCLDCEDGVALNRKTEARDNIRDILDTQRIDFGASECSVRVNSLESGLCREDVLAVLGGRHLPSALHLPKCGGREDLLALTGAVREALVRPLDRPLGLIMFIESARALLDIDTICREARQICEDSGLMVPEAVVFGSDDFAADIGATRTADCTELLLARQTVVLAAKAHRLQAIDAVYIDYKDTEGLRRQAEEGARWGFTGKQVIHPGQVEVVQEAFSPSQERLEWAQELVREHREQQGQGRGAFTFRGAMIDMPTVRQAENVLAMAGRGK